MKILWLVTSVPFPPDTGGKMDSYFLIREFSRMGHEITAGIIYFGDSPPTMPSEFSGLVRDIVFLPGNPKSLQSRLLGSLADEVPFKFRKYYSESAVKILADRIQKGPVIDAIVADHLHLVPLILDARKVLKKTAFQFPTLILRTANVESTIVKKYAERIDNPMVKAFASQEARKMRTYEGRVLKDFDMVAAISPVDQDTLRKMSGLSESIKYVTAGMDVEKLKPPSEPPTKGEVIFVGSFDWHPNVDGAIWLLDKVWPLVTKRLPEAHLSIVGKSPPPYLQKLASATVSIPGRVDVIEEYVGKSSCSVVPLWIGSGMRYKILEAFALARAVVSTSLGAEGIEITDGENILIRDDPEAFSDGIVQILQDAEFRDRLGMNARKLVEEKYSWPKVAGGFAADIEALAGKRVG
jgi:polysaccharide biosynthesis protein PslH